MQNNRKSYTIFTYGKVLQRSTFLLCEQPRLHAHEALFFDFTLFFIKCGKHVNNLPSGIISAISAHVMGNSFLSTVAACAKSPRFQRVVTTHPVAVPFRMSHTDYHILLY